MDWYFRDLLLSAFHYYEQASQFPQNYEASLHQSKCNTQHNLNCKKKSQKVYLVKNLS